MALLYRNRKLKTWYLRFYNPDLADAIPEPTDLCSDGEAAVQCDIVAKQVKSIYKKARKYLVDNGRFDKDEIAQLMKKIPELESARNELTGFIHYIKSLSDELEK